MYIVIQVRCFGQRRRTAVKSQSADPLWDEQLFITGQVR